MQTKTFTSGRIRRADCDAVSRQLDLHWDDQSILSASSCPPRSNTPGCRRATRFSRAA